MLCMHFFSTENNHLLIYLFLICLSFLSVGSIIETYQYSKDDIKVIKNETVSNPQQSPETVESYSSQQEQALEIRLRQQLQTLAMVESGVELPSSLAAGERLLPSPIAVSETTLALHALEVQRGSMPGEIGHLRLYVDSAKYTKTTQARDIAFKALANSTINPVDYAYYKAELDALDDIKDSSAGTLFTEIDDLIDYTSFHHTDAEPFLRQEKDNDGNANPLSKRAVDFYLETKADFIARTPPAKTSLEDIEQHGIYSSLTSDLEAFMKMDTSSQIALFVAGKEITKDIAVIGATIAPEQVEEVIGVSARESLHDGTDTDIAELTPDQVILIAEAEYLVASKIADATSVVTDETMPAQWVIDEEVDKLGKIVDIVLENTPNDSDAELVKVVSAIKQARSTHTDPRIAAEVLADYSVQNAA